MEVGLAETSTQLVATFLISHLSHFSSKNAKDLLVLATPI